MGKTALALGMATNVAHDRATRCCSSRWRWATRSSPSASCASEARVDSQKLRTGRLDQSDWSKIGKALGRLEMPLFIDENPNVTVMEIRAKARRVKARHGGLGLIVVDYLQLMSGSGAENRQLEISEISRGLKILARELKCPVIALSQLSRNLESRADKRPMLADLRESGSIEQDADVVMFVYRDEVYNAESADRGLGRDHRRQAPQRPDRDPPVWSSSARTPASRTRPRACSRQRGSSWRADPVRSTGVFLGEDLLAWLILALGGALAVGNLLAVLRPPPQTTKANSPRPRSLAVPGWRSSA